MNNEEKEIDKATTVVPMIQQQDPMKTKAR
jgi:hypothetical protein